LHAVGAVEVRLRRLEIGERAVNRKARVQIPAELLLQLIARGRRQQAQAKVRRADRVRLVDDLRPALVEAVGRAGKSERDEQTEQREYGGFDDTAR